MSHETDGRRSVTLEGSVAVVTGASSGIGRATALALAIEGATVSLAARRVDRLDALVEEIGSTGGTAKAIPTDMRDQQQITAMVESTRSAFGRIDILVNSAGVGHWNALGEATLEDLRDEIEVNLLGLMTATRLVLPVMQEQGSGDIVIVSSLSGRGPGPGWPGYTASKWGLTGFSESIRRDLRDKRIRVTLIEPGEVATEMQTEDEIAAQRMLEAEDVAGAIVYAVTRPPHVCIGDIQLFSIPDPPAE